MSRMDLLVSEVMSHPAVTIPPETRVSAVFGIAATQGIHHFPITARGILVGFVCTCDLRNAPPESEVGSLARQPVITVSRSSRASDAARSMSTHAVGSAVVTDGDVVCGIVTREDLARVDEELAPWIGEYHCAGCGSHQHLSAGPDSTYLCAYCGDRIRGKDWFDFGNED